MSVQTGADVIGIKKAMIDASEKLQNTYYNRASDKAKVSYGYDWSDLNDSAVVMSVQSGADVIGIKKAMIDASEKLQNTFYNRAGDNAKVSYGYDWSDLNDSVVVMSVQSGADVIGIKKAMMGVVKNWQESTPKAGSSYAYLLGKNKYPLAVDGILPLNPLTRYRLSF